jgi:hypothetical protein
MKQRLKMNLNGFKSTQTQASTTVSSSSLSQVDMNGLMNTASPQNTNGTFGTGLTSSSQYAYTEDIRRVDLVSNIQGGTSNSYY